MWARAQGAHRWLRAASIIGALFAVASCTDQPPVTPKSPLAPGHARLSVRPSFARQAPGTPLVVLSSIRGILIGPAGDSIVVEARFDGDSAILVFDVPVTGGAANYTLDLTGFDGNHQEAYHATREYTLRPGDNSVPTPEWQYSAPDSKLANLHVAPGSATLNSGANATFGVNGTNAANQPISPILVAWSVKDASIATVDASGQVHAGDTQGSTYVIARTVTNLADSALIRVHAPVSRVAVAPATLELIRGKSGAAAAELRDATNHLIDDRTATWSSSDASVATVSSSGVIQAIKNGTATITASAEGKTGSVAVTVVTPIDHITVAPASLTFASLGEAQNVTVTVVPKAGASVDGITPTIGSSNTAVATIDATNKVTARANGTSTITATAEGVTGSANVTVQQVAASITVSPSSQGVSALGDSRHYSAAAVDALGNAVALPIAWTSSDATIAAVDGDGNATGRALGSVTITAKSGDRTATATFNVAQVPAGVGISADRTTLQVGNSATLTARVVDANGNTIPGGFANFSSQNPSIVSVAGNRATAVAVGNASVSASVGSASASLTIHVDPIGGPFAGGGASGTVTDGSTTLPIAGATVAPSSGAPITTFGDGTFTLSNVTNGSTLTVSATGYVTTQYFNLPTTAGGVGQVGTIPLAPVSGSNGVITGRVQDATTTFGISTATVTIRSGINALTGTAIATPSVDANGNFSQSLPAGTYTITAAASGFALGSATTVSVGGTTRNNQNVSLVPGTGLRITLTWGANPRDLDSHLFGPAAGGGRFHTWFAGRNGPDGESLDNDFTGGFGPENTTVPTPLPGVYRFYVQHYSGTSSMNAGNATVTVTLNGVVLGVFHPPARPSEADGDIWQVFSLSGSTITALNTFVSGSSGSVPESIRSRGARTSSTSTASDVTSDIEAIRQAGSRPKQP